MQPAVSVNQLTKTFGATHAVNNVSFHVKQGEVLGFLGPNGAGKSTTMKMITGFVAPDAGSISVLGQKISEAPLHAKKHIGYLPEGAPCYPDMTSWEFLNFIADIRQLKGAHKKNRLDKIIDDIQLQSVLHQTIETLSKGYKRRIGLAQALLHDPDILILDEPTDGLDPNQKHEVRTLIRNMAKNKAIILSTHILEEVDAICTRAIIIAGGSIVADAPPSTLAAQSSLHNAVTLGIASAHLEEAKSSLAAIDNLHQMNILRSDDTTIVIQAIPKPGARIFPEINQMTTEKSWRINHLSVESGRLDDYFRDITSDKQARN